MFRSNLALSMLATTSVLIAALLTACDQNVGGDDDDQLSDAEPVVESPDLSEPPTSTSTSVPDASANSINGQNPAQANHVLAGTTESFYFSGATDTIATTSAPGGLFGPFPAGIPVFDEPLLANGFLIAFKIYDENNNLVGFGTEQEVIDFENALSDSTYMLTLPGRGTLMLKHTEDFTVYFAEIDDMVADEDYIRVFDPPLPAVTTVPQSGKIVGGSGEFAGAKGKMKEIDMLYEVNLTDQMVDVDAEIRVKFK